MPLTTRQRNIINPFADALLLERAGTSYDYNNQRNRFVINAIHEKFLTLGNFPPINYQLIGIEENETFPDKLIREKDLNAYAALYRQNAKVAQLDDGNVGLVLLTDEEIDRELSSLVSDLGDNISKYTTKSAPATLTEGFDSLSIEEKRKLTLVSLPPNYSYEYQQSLRNAMDISEEIYNPTRQFETTTPISNYLVANDPAIDLYNWHNNALPGTEKEKVYYNSNNDTFVYTFRSNKTAYPHYDVGYLILDEDWVPDILETNFLGQSDYDAGDDNPRPTSEQIVARYAKIRNQGVKKILQFAGKYTRENAQEIIGARPDDDVLKLLVALRSPILSRLEPQYQSRIQPDTPDYPHFQITSYLDGRPGSRWIFRVTVERTFVDRLAGRGNITEPSYQESEITNLQKSQIILEQPEPIKSFYGVSQLYRYTAYAQMLLRIYADDMAEEGILPYMANNVDLAFEAEKLGNLSDKFDLFYSYNQRSLDAVNDRVELFLSDEYDLLYVAIDGDVYTRGTGNSAFYPSVSADERILDAFAPYTPTTFSYYTNVEQLAQVYVNSSEEDRPQWSDVLPEYTYPEFDVGAAQLLRGNTDRALLNLLKKKDSIFQTIADRQKVSPAEIKRIFDNRNLTWSPRTVNVLKGEVASLGCNEGFGKLLNLSLSVMSEVMGRNRAHKYIREIIFFTRDELINESVKNYRLPAIAPNMNASTLPLGALSYSQNRDYVFRQVKQAVDRQIHCGLAITSNFIEQSFLDSKQLPPEAKSLVRGWKNGTAFGLNIDGRGGNLNPRVELKSPYGSGPKTLLEIQRQVWKKMLNEIVKNMLKALVIGIFKDVLKAALGCGPDSIKVDPQALRNSMSLQDYGFANLSLYITGVDVLEVARFVNMVPSDSTVSDQNLTEQITELITDISIMSTPAELQQMLEGAASSDLFDHISESVNGAKVVYASNPNMDVISSSEDGKIEINPADYPNLDRSPDVIQAFVKELGRRMYSQTIPNIEIQSPLEAYCDERDPMIQPLRFILSNEQLVDQYAITAQEKIDYLNWLCGILQSGQSFQFQLQAMVDALPSFDWYTNSLATLSKASQRLWEWLIKSLRWDDEQANARDPVYNIFTTQMGIELYYTTALGSTPGVSPPGRAGTELAIGDTLTRGTGLPDGIYYQMIGEEPGSGGQPGGMLLPFSPLTGELALDRGTYYRLRTSPEQVRPPLPRDITPGARERSFNSDVNWYVRNNTSFAPALGYVEPLYAVVQNKNVRGVNTPAKGGFQIYALPQNNSADAQTGLSPINGETDEIEQPPVYFLAQYCFKTEGSAQEPIYPAINYYFFQQMFDITNNQVREQYSIYDGNDGSRVIDLQSSDGIRYLSKFSYNGTVATEAWTAANGIEMGDFGYFPTNKRGAAGHPPTREERYVDTIAVNNDTESIYYTLNASYITARAKQVLNRWSQVLAENPLKESEEPCLDLLKEQQGKALSASIQQRVQMFMLNVFPLRRVYPAWNSLLTIKLITDYLTRKIIREYKTYEMWGVVQEAISSFEYVYGDIPVDPNLDTDGYSQKLFGIVERMLVGEGVAIKRDNLEEGQEMGYFHRLGVDGSIYDRETVTGRRYAYNLGSFYISMLDAIVQRNQETRNKYNLTEPQRSAMSISLQEFMNARGNSARTNYKNFRLSDDGYLYGLYYMPTPLSIAQALIYYDHSVKVMHRYSAAARQNNALKVAADQALMLSMRGTMESGYDFDITLYPITVQSTIRRTINTVGEYNPDGGLGGHNSKYTLRTNDFQRTYTSAEELEQQLHYLQDRVSEELQYFVILSDPNYTLAERTSILKNNDINIHMDTNDYNFSFDPNFNQWYNGFINGLLNVGPQGTLGRIPEIIRGSGINPETGIIDRANVDIVLAQLVIVASQADGVVQAFIDQGDQESDEYWTATLIRQFLQYYAGKEPGDTGSLGLVDVLGEIEELRRVLASTRKSIRTN